MNPLKRVYLSFGIIFIPSIASRAFPSSVKTLLGLAFSVLRWLKIPRLASISTITHNFLDSLNRSGESNFEAILCLQNYVLLQYRRQQLRNNFKYKTISCFIYLLIFFFFPRKAHKIRNSFLPAPCPLEPFSLFSCSSISSRFSFWVQTPPRSALLFNISGLIK